MAARETMAQLIERLRVMIHDPAGDTATWGDEELQQFLDEHRKDVRREELVVKPNADGSFTDYYATYGYWEADATLEDAGGSKLTPASFEWIVGHWTFASSTPPPVYATGKVYDLYGAAADVLEAWAAREALEFDFSVGDQRFARSQKRQALLELAAQYEQQAWPEVAPMRTDLEV